MPDRHVAVLGCGVIGLSTAIAILEANVAGPVVYTVTIVAKECPQPLISQPGQESGKDAASSVSRPSAGYASAWAGAHHVSDAKTEQELRHDQLTFDRMTKLVQDRPWAKAPGGNSGPFSSLHPVLSELKTSQSPNGEPLVWVHQKELFEAATNAQGKPPYLGVLDWYPDFTQIHPAMLPAGIGAGCTFSTLDINVPVYLNWLLQRFLQLGGRLIAKEVSSLSDAIKVSSSADVKQETLSVGCPHRVDALIVSPGLGALALTDVHDEDVHPQRGQVVVIRAPWLTTALPLGQDNKSKHSLPGMSIVRAQGGRETYIIPRGDGTVICGGTRLIDDWDSSPRPETTRQILARCLRLAPGLVNPEKRTLVTEPRVEDLEVVSVNVGLRPSRRGGVRLEQGADIDGVKVIHNYGYGGWGYQASWGAALQAKKLMEEALSLTSVPHPRL